MYHGLYNRYILINLCYLLAWKHGLFQCSNTYFANCTFFSMYYSQQMYYFGPLLLKRQPPHDNMVVPSVTPRRWPCLFEVNTHKPIKSSSQMVSSQVYLEAPSLEMLNWSLNIGSHSWSLTWIRYSKPRRIIYDGCIFIGSKWISWYYICWCQNNA